MYPPLTGSRPCYATRASLRRAQELHLRPGAPDGCRHASGGQSTEILGMGDRQATAQGITFGVTLPLNYTCNLVPIVCHRSFSDPRALGGVYTKKAVRKTSHHHIHKNSRYGLPGPTACKARRKRRLRFPTRRALGRPRGRNLHGAGLP